MPHPLTHFIRHQSAPDNLPPAALTAAKAMLVNAAAVGLAGAAQPESFAITRFIQEMGGNGKCTLIGKGLRTSPVYAALANALMISLLDFDDQIIPGAAGPSAVAFPPAMAIGEIHGSPGAEVLAAFILGCELSAKLSDLLPPDTAQAVAAAAAAGCLLNLDAAPLESALVLAAGRAAAIPPVPPPAASSANLLPPADTARPPSDTATPARAYRQAQAAMQGSAAALLAQQGLTAAAGLSDLFPNANDRQIADHCAALGQPYALLDPGVTLKLYPCAAAAHPAIDAALQLMQQYRIGANDITAASVSATPAALAELPYPTPADSWQARHCLSYILAATLTWGHPLLDTFTDAAVQDRAVRRLMDAITVTAAEPPSPSIPYPCALTLSLTDGRQLQHRVEFARGGPQLPLTPEELDAKFLYCSRYILPPDHIDEAITNLRNLENIPNTTGLFSVLGG